MKKSKPISVDRSVHPLLDALGGFGAVVAVGLVAVLSVCAAFFIYRSFRGQRGKSDATNGSNGSTGSRAAGEERDRPTESTEECQDGKSRNESSSFSTHDDNMQPPSEEPEEDLNESTLKDLEEITDDQITSGDKTDSDLDQCVEMDPDEKTECEDHIQHEDDGGLDVLGDASVRSASEEHHDTDEPSETESAQEMIYQRRQGHVTSQHASNPAEIHLEEETKTSMLEESSKKFEDCLDWRLPTIESCCHQKVELMEKTKVQPLFHGGSYATDTVNSFHNYLGFHVDNSFICGPSTRVSLANASGEKKVDEEGASVEKTQKKNEISIMEAIMDNNEWLNIGAPEIRDLPWLTPTSTSSEEQQTEQVEMVSAREEDERVKKRVATVPPLSPTINVTFRIHYVTYSPSQLVAVTGSLQELGAWEGFIPLHRSKDGFWANTITLPVESQVEWKFVLVEDGRISRWEECGNRSLFLTSQDEEVHLEKCWGFC